MKKYPAELIINFYYCFFVAIQSAAAALIMERSPGAWSLEPSTRFIAVMYSVSGLKIHRFDFNI